MSRHLYRTRPMCDATEVLGRDVLEWIRAQRSEGYTWGELADNLWALGVDVQPETLRRWGYYDRCGR